MIGKILIISDEGGYIFAGDTKEEWHSHGYEVDNKSFAEVMKYDNVDEYFLIAFINDNKHNQLFHEYSKILRSKTSVPIVFFPYGENSVSEEIAFLHYPADEVINLPTNIELAVANCIALIRRNSEEDSHANPPMTVHVDEKILLDASRYVVQVDGREIKLRRKEFEILHYLMQHRCMIMTYNQIFKAIWGYEYIDSDKKTLWNQMYILRNKLQWHSGLPEFIYTKHGVGYSFAPHYKKTK